MSRETCDKIEKLKTLWDKINDKYSSKISIAKAQHNNFLEQFPKNKPSLDLDRYTNIKTNENADYFTNWIERKTDSCGRFSAPSSFAYGIYRINIENIKNYNGKDENKIKNYFKNISEAYGTFEKKNEKDVKKKYITNKNDAKQYFEKNVLPKLESIISFVDINDTKPLDINFARKVAYMYNPDKLLPVFKNEVILSIADFFDVEIDIKSYKATKELLEKITDKFNINETLNFDITQKLMHFLWEYFGKQVPFECKNIIFYGAPGTGKTYTVFNSVRQKVLISGNDIDDVAIFTQFHPSFSYEDFIEGLKPEINDNGMPTLKLTNGIFKNFCKKAMETLIKEKKDNKKDNELTKYYFVVDEINRAELSSVFGELLLCLEEDKRVDFELKDNKLVLKENSMVIDTQYSYLITKKEDAVLVLNSDNTVYSSGDQISNLKYKFGIPINLYFIGTMNDIDRSIDTFDLALRRRFLWERMDYNWNVIKESDKFSNVENIDEYIGICNDLNKYIANTLGLGKSYQIGHSYFMEVKIFNKEISSTAVENLFNKKLKPLIEEYLRANYTDNEIEEKIKEAKKKFKLEK